MKLQETKPAQRCAYCHSDGERLEICPNCQTSIHLSCLQETRSCPTIGCDAPVRRSIKLAAKTISWAQYSVYSPQDRPPPEGECFHCRLPEDLHAGTGLHCPTNANALMARRSGQLDTQREIEQRQHQRREALTTAYLKGLVFMGAVGLFTLLLLGVIFRAIS